MYSICGRTTPSHHRIYGIYVPETETVPTVSFNTSTMFTEPFTGSNNIICCTCNVVTVWHQAHSYSHPGVENKPRVSCRLTLPLHYLAADARRTKSRSHPQPCRRRVTANHLQHRSIPPKGCHRAGMCPHSTYCCAFVGAVPSTNRTWLVAIRSI